jgi:hypothetical protein
VFGQNDSFYDLRQNANYDSIVMDEKCLYTQDNPKGDLNYVKTLLYTWKLMKTDSVRFSSDHSGHMLQPLSYVGDIQSINWFSSKNMAPYPQLKDTAYTNKFKRRKLNYHSAKDFILQNAKDKQIIMFNEGHDRPQTRAFVVSILADLKKKGYVYLALETFDERGNLKELDCSTGIYTQEPMSGEVVREGLRLGFKLIPYEHVNQPTQMNDIYTPKRNKIDEREVGEANNLYNRIKTKTGIEKTVVLAGYGHIAKTYDSTFTSMAMYFKKFSGINPLAIDQTTLLEENEHSAYANKLLNIMLNKDSIFAFTPKEAKMFGVDSTAYDIYVYHPHTTYSHNRPTWLITSADKYFVSIEVPKSIKPVLVQAFVKTEIKSDEDYKIKIPCDQTFYSENNNVWLVLRKGKEYKIIYRDDKNRIVFKKDIKT